MASIEDALYTRLQAVSAFTDLVSDRVYPDGKDHGDMLDFPYVTYDVLSTERNSAFTDDTGYVESNVRFHVWAKDAASVSGYDKARDVGVAIRNALQRWSGTSAGVTVNHVFIDGEFDIGDPEPGIYHRVLDFDTRWFE